MTITMLKSKLHHLRVTRVDLEYQGACWWMKRCWPRPVCNFEKILVANLANGERFETYAIAAKLRQR